MTDIIGPDPNHAGSIIRAGGLVGLPTETVYGLAADASNEQAIAKVFAAKGRPANHPLIIHISNLNQVTRWAKSLPPQATLLAKAFWPGPLTLILAKAAATSNLITGGQDTVALRMPAHPMAQAVLQAADTAVVAPSANRFGRVSPTCPQDVLEELGDQVDYILDGGPCQVGIESTIVDLSSLPNIRILRHGMITQESIKQCLHCQLEPASANAPRVSGNLSSHYAPQTKVMLIDPVELDAFLAHSRRHGLRLSVMARRSPQTKTGQNWYTLPKNAHSYAQMLYQTLRAADSDNADIIAIEAVPQQSAWLGIADRLQKAQGHN